MVVHGEDGLDEITLSGKTFVAEALQRAGKDILEIDPNSFGLARAPLAHLRGGDAETNAATIREVFEGKRKDEARSLVIMTAAAALAVGEVTDDLSSARDWLRKQLTAVLHGRN